MPANELHFFKLKDENNNNHIITLGQWLSRTTVSGYHYNVDLTWIVNNFPESDTAVTMICLNSQIEQATHILGFPLTVVFNDHIGEKWYFNNGSYIYFNGSLTRLEYFTSDDVLQVAGTPLTNNNIRSFFGFPSNYGSIIEGQGYFYQQIPINLDGTSSFSGNSSIIYGGLNAQQTAGMDLFYTGVVPELENTDPYNPGGDSSEGGGTGDFDLTSDPIDFPNLPSLSAVDTGFITLFNPSLAELQSLANYMWDGTLFDLSTWQKLFADPMDAILGLSIVPVAVPNAGQANIKVGNIATPISMNKAGAQYVTVDCGSLNVNEYWGAYLDYEPYSKAEIYLPYCGIHPIAIDDIMGKSVHVKYNVDILSGACCAMVKCGDSVLYSFIGQCASSIPISGTDFTQMINGIISAAVSVGSMVASGGATAPLAVPSLANTAVNSMKPSIEKSGAMGGTGGMLGIQKPYLILTRPKQALPTNQNRYTGYPSYITSNLGDLTGYTEIEKVHLEGFTGTDFELQETLKLLETGVIF